MTYEEVKQLNALLSKFASWDTAHQSLYGRKMDIALATDLQATLPAYGLTFNLKLKLYNGEEHVKKGYITHNAAQHVGNCLLNTCGEDGNEFTSQIVSFEIV